MEARLQEVVETRDDLYDKLEEKDEEIENLTRSAQEMITLQQREQGRATKASPAKPAKGAEDKGPSRGRGMSFLNFGRSSEEKSTPRGGGATPRIQE